MPRARRALAALVLAAGCVPQTPTVARPRVALEYPQGICAARDAVVRPREPIPLLQAAQRALDRGCPGEAEALLDVEPGELRGWSPNAAAVWGVLSVEAAQDTWTLGLLRDGVTLLPMVMGQEEGQRFDEVLLRRIDLLDQARRRGLLPPVFVASGRFARLETRAFPSFNCLHGSRPSRWRSRARTRAARAQVWRETRTLDPATAGGALAAARDALRAASGPRAAPAAGEAALAAVEQARVAARALGDAMAAANQAAKASLDEEYGRWEEAYGRIQTGLARNPEPGSPLMDYLRLHQTIAEVGPELAAWTEAVVVTNGGLDWSGRTPLTRDRTAYRPTFGQPSRVDLTPAQIEARLAEIRRRRQDVAAVAQRTAAQLTPDAALDAQVAGARRSTAARTQRCRDIP